MTRHRDRIQEYVAEHPGTHFNALARALELAPGQVQHHLRRLREQDRVVAEQLYGRTHYYTPAYGDWERGAIAVLRRETARDALFHLLEDGPASPGAVADELDVARSTLEWHLEHLIEQDLVEKRRDERGRVTVHLLAPAETVALLEEITPTLPDRMLDRFTRLVDRFLGE